MAKGLTGFEAMRQANRQDLKQDVVAGLIVAIMLVPQGMAYAMLAGMPPVTGLYAATIPLLIYALLGTSRQLAVGPVAIVSLLVFSGVSELAEPGSAEYVGLVLLLALMVGVIQLVLGFLRLGAVTRLMSHAVISGFTSAAAVIIAFSQLKHLLGYEFVHDASPVLMAGEAVTRLDDIHVLTLLLGVAGVVLLLLFKRIPKIPGPLVAVVFGILTVASLQLADSGVDIVGDVPAGLPPISFPTLTMSAVVSLLPTAVVIAIIGYAESYAMAKIIAAREKYALDANRELIGLGSANLATTFFSGFPVTGGFSRSAVNYESGAKTPFAGIVSALFVLLALLFFTSWFYYLPQAILGAIIIVAVVKLIDVKEAVHLWRIRRSDAVTLMLTFVTTLVLGIELGLVTGIIFSLLLFVWRNAFPDIVELGYRAEEGVYRNPERYPDVDIDPEVLVCRMDAPLYFTNVPELEEQLQKRLDARREIRGIVLDFSGINDMDAVAADELKAWMKERVEQGYQIAIARAKGPVRDVMKRASFSDVIGDEAIAHVTVDSAKAELKAKGGV
ncbi:SulP family inorganic anion transporter [Texcoconibacillus texcoconensis]|nr:sulfate permease [Texcoconibacillus texcoconensis]